MATIEKEKVLDVVRQMVADGQVSQEVAEKYFPELKENERIRKAILSGLKYLEMELGWDAIGDIDILDAYTWFEKQGEPVEINPTEFNIRLQALIGRFGGLPKEELIGSLSFWMNAVQNDETYKDEEKQGEQKSDIDFSDLRTWKYIVDAVWTEKEGIGQYLDSPFTEEVAKKLQKRFGNIEQKPVIEEVNGEDYGIDGLWHAQRILEKTLGCVDGYQSDDGILDHKAAITAVKKLYEQKPAEWSEEDEKCIRLSMDIIESALRAGFCVQLDRDRCVDWLNSLRSQKQWRPSKDQMKALAEALSLAKNCGEESAFDLRTLHEQLKKLRKE